MASSGGGSYYAPEAPDMPMVYWGCTGDAVKTLQDKLNALGYNSGSVDGIFGAKTYAAVTAFQKANSLGVDGIVGKLTWGKLYGVSPAMPVETTTVVGRPTVSYGSRGDAVRKLQELLNALGYDIRLRRGRSGGYWMATRPFELAELKLLVDAVQSSRVISKASSDKLIHKLEGLASQYEGSQLQRQVYVDGRPKSANKDLPYSVDALFTAINTGRMVRFRYKKAGRPAPYTISPWQMAWENGCYYLIAYQDEKEPVGIRHYRVDKMAGVTVLDEPRRGKEQFADLDLPAYLKKHFQMFGGPEYRVTLRCTSDLESAMRERFGASPIFVPEGKEHFHFDVPVCVSDQFYGWVCGFGGKIEVVSPAEVRDGLRALNERLVKMHQ